MEIDQSHLVREPFQVAYALERGDESYVDVPVLTEIELGLWFGGAPEPRPPEGFDFIVNLVAAWARYDPNGIECVNVAVEDGEETAEVAKQFGDLAHEVNRRRDLGQTILVHCQVGLNRSATVVALALMLRGVKAEDAIRLLREKRHRLVMCNPHFERWLLDDELLSGGASVTGIRLQAPSRKSLDGGWLPPRVRARAREADSAARRAFRRLGAAAAMNHRRTGEGRRGPSPDRRSAA